MEHSNNVRIHIAANVSHVVSLPVSLRSLKESLKGSIEPTELRYCQLSVNSAGPSPPFVLTEDGEFLVPDGVPNLKLVITPAFNPVGATPANCNVPADLAVLCAPEASSAGTGAAAAAAAAAEPTPPESPVPPAPSGFASSLVSAASSTGTYLYEKGKDFAAVAAKAVGIREPGEAVLFADVSKAYEDRIGACVALTLANNEPVFQPHGLYFRWYYWDDRCGFGPFREVARSALGLILTYELKRHAKPRMHSYYDDIRSCLCHELKCYFRALSTRTTLTTEEVVRRIAYLDQLGRIFAEASPTLCPKLSQLAAMLTEHVLPAVRSAPLRTLIEEAREVEAAAWSFADAVAGEDAAAREQIAAMRTRAVDAALLLEALTATTATAEAVAAEGQPSLAIEIAACAHEARLLAATVEAAAASNGPGGDCLFWLLSDAQRQSVVNAAAALANTLEAFSNAQVSSAPGRLTLRANAVLLNSVAAGLVPESAVAAPATPTAGAKGAAADAAGPGAGSAAAGGSETAALSRLVDALAARPRLQGGAQQ